MKVLNVIIVDDELACVESLAIELTHYCEGINILAKCTTPVDALSKIQELKPDLVFLDIEMPWMNGFELLQQFDPIPFEVIFATAYDKFALKAFEFSAVDYLLKPMNKDNLIAAVKKVRQRISKSISNDHLKVLLENITKKNRALPIIAVPDMEGINFIQVDDIIYCEADNNYTNIHQNGGKKIVISKSLKVVENMLSDHTFVRIHQSYLVNVIHVKKYIKSDGRSIIMRNEKELPVSRSKKDELLDFLNY